MSFESAADRLATLAALGEQATFRAAPITGVFEKAYVEVNGVESFRPVFTCRDSDVPDVVHDETVIISAVVYSIVGIQPDGTGMTVLILEAQ